LKIPKWLSESRKSKDRQINGQQKKRWSTKLFAEN
jgi:hypothetical protein